MTDLALPLWLLLLLLLVDGTTLGFFTPTLLIESGKHHPPWQIGVFGGMASAAGSMIQLRVFQWILSGKFRWVARFAPTRERVEEALDRYRSASFLGLVLARATPIPDLPIKIVAAIGRYPVHRYGLATFLGSLPYYYLLAKVGEVFAPPFWFIVVALAAIALVGVGERWLRSRRGSA